MKKIVALVIMVATLAGCAKPKDLEFVDIQNIRMISLGLKESLIGLDARFYNPNNQRVQLKDANAKLYVNSAYLGDTQMDSTISIPKKDTFAVPLVVKLKTMSAVTNALQSLADSTVEIKVEGNVKMGKAGVFISYPINYQRNQNVSELNLNF